MRVRLPYDFKHPLRIKRNDEDIYCVDKQDVNDVDTSFSIDVTRISLHDKRNLILRPSDFEMLNIPNQRSENEYGFGYNIYGVGSSGDVSLGYLFDNSNLFVPENIDDDTPMNILIKIRDAGDDINRYNDVKRTEDGDVLEILTVFGLYSIIVNNTPETYYIAENGFTYDAEDLTTANLLTRGKLGNNNFVLNPKEIEEGDEFEIFYTASAQLYINENQVDTILDTFKKAIFTGAVVEGFKYLKKPNKAREWAGYYSDELRLIEREAGKVNMFGKQKFFRSASRKYRLPFQR